MRKYPFFSLLSPWKVERQVQFLGGLAHETFGNGVSIFEKGDKTTDAYFLLHGAVKSLNYNANGKISYFRLRHAGDCFGYYSAISGEPRTATMMAVGEVEVARMPGEDFFSLVIENPDIGRNFLRLVVGLLRTETERLTNLTAFSACQRLVAEILSCPAGEPFLMPDRIEFAGYLGMSRETLSRALSSLSRKKLIRVSVSRITILNRPALEALVGDESSEV